MRSFFILLILASPATAWEFSPAPICTLTDTSDADTLTVTYAASLPEYTITITLPDGQWSDAPGFAMAFAGHRPIGIQTDRHTRSEDGRSLAQGALAWVLAAAPNTLPIPGCRNEKQAV